MTATPGRRAYEAGGGAIHSYERIQRRAWDDLPPAVREGYEAAVAAVETEQVRLARADRDQLRKAVLDLAAAWEDEGAHGGYADALRECADQLRHAAEPPA